MEKETIEDVYLNKLIDEANKEWTLDRKLTKEVALKFAKWQAEQDKNKYSEEEVIEILTLRCDHFSTTRKPFRDLLLKQDLEWFEQFKKKTL